VECGRSGVGKPVRIVHLLPERLVAAPADVGQLPFPGRQGRLPVKVDGDPVFLGVRSAETVRDPDCVRHGRVAEGDEGHHVNRSDARMRACVFPHVDHFQGPAADGQRRVPHGIRGADEGQNAAVMVPVHANVEQLHAGQAGQRPGDLQDFLPAPAFADVGDALDDLHWVNPAFRACMP